MQRHEHFVFALAATLTARALAQDLPPTDESLAAYADTAHSVTLADGRAIHFVCMGAGSPTVILTAGLGNWAASWKEVQPTLARTTRACACHRPPDVRTSIQSVAGPAGASKEKS